MNSIDIKLKALFNILSGFQFLHPCKHALISLHNTAELPHFNRKGNAALCYSHKHVMSQPWSSSPATISKQQHQKLIPARPAWSCRNRAPSAPSTQMAVAHRPRARASPTKGKTQFPKAVWGVASLSHNSSSSFEKATTHQLHPG